MSLFAIGGANAAIPEMYRVAVEIENWMTDQQFADMFAISQISPGPNVHDRTADRLSGRRGRRRAGRNAGDVRADLRLCLLCRAACCARSNQSRWPAVIQAALVPLSIGLMSAQRLFWR